MFDNLRNRIMLALAVRRSLRGNRMARVSMEQVGAALVVAGALVALVTLFAALFIPAATWTLLDSEIGAILGIILVIVGIAARAAD